MLTDDTFAAIFTATRASAGWRFDEYGALAELASNVLRLDYDPATLAPRGMILEGAGSNLIRNPRAEFLAAPSFPQATAPAFWALLDTSGFGVAGSFVAAGNVGGVDYVDVRWQGTSTGGTLRLTLEPTLAVTVAAGGSYTLALATQLVGGSLANLSGALLRATTFDAITVATASPTTTLTRRSAAFSSAAGFTGSTALSWNITAAAGAVDVTVRFALPQFEAGGFATSPILPPVGTRAASTRAADAVAVSGAAFSRIFGAAAPQGWCIADVVLAGIGAGTFPRVFELSDGTTSNYINLHVDGSGVTWRASSASGGALTNGVTPAATVNAIHRVGVRWNNSSGFALSLNGAAPVPTAAAAPIGLDRLTLGNRPDGARPLNGWLRNVWAGPGAPNDAQFAAACSPGADVAAALR